MREIKFRAWDKINHRMREVKDLIWSQGELISAWLSGEANRPTCLYREHFELIEYTGLKDKNDKEIYEGDIIEAGYWGTAGYYGEDTFVVELEEGAFRGFMCEYLKQKKHRWTHSAPLYTLEGIKVIGNIYENSELLEVK